MAGPRTFVAFVVGIGIAIGAGYLDLMDPTLLIQPIAFAGVLLFISLFSILHLGFRETLSVLGVYFEIPNKTVETKETIEQREKSLVFFRLHVGKWAIGAGHLIFLIQATAFVSAIPKYGEDIFKMAVHMTPDLLITYFYAVFFSLLLSGSPNREAKVTQIR